jgi:hypothetical protein
LAKLSSDATNLRNWKWEDELGHAPPTERGSEVAAQEYWRGVLNGYDGVIVAEWNGFDMTVTDE